MHKVHNKESESEVTFAGRALRALRAEKPKASARKRKRDSVAFGNTSLGGAA